LGREAERDERNAPAAASDAGKLHPGFAAAFDPRHRVFIERLRRHVHLARVEVPGLGGDQAELGGGVGAGQVLAWILFGEAGSLRAGEGTGIGLARRHTAENVADRAVQNAVHRADLAAGASGGHRFQDGGAAANTCRVKELGAAAAGGGAEQRQAAAHHALAGADHMKAAAERPFAEQRPRFGAGQGVDEEVGGDVEKGPAVGGERDRRSDGAGAEGIAHEDRDDPVVGAGGELFGERLADGAVAGEGDAQRARRGGSGRRRGEGNGGHDRSFARSKDDVAWSTLLVAVRPHRPVGTATLPGEGRLAQATRPALDAEALRPCGIRASAALVRR
jgi:hypothetical protein